MGANWWLSFVGLGLIAVGVLLIVFRVRMAAWQTRVSQATTLVMWRRAVVVPPWQMVAIGCIACLMGAILIPAALFGHPPK